MNPWMQAAGIGLEAYGSYQAQEQAEREWHAAVRAWEAEMERDRKREEDRRRDQALQNALSVGNYAQGLQNDVYGSYTPWSQAIGR